jgi:superfamily II DNA/RNA helicase/antitoxin (DNA-binding transcriptional repressor) of toxin-antitoxin stability system
LGDARPVFTRLLARAEAEGIRIRLLRRGVEVAGVVGAEDLDRLRRLDLQDGLKPVWNPQRPESPREAREQLSDRLIAVETGERVVILKRKRTYAAIIPPSDLARLEGVALPVPRTDQLPSPDDVIASTDLATHTPESAPMLTIAPADMSPKLGAEPAGPKIEDLWREALWDRRHDDVSVRGEMLLEVLRSPQFKGPGLDKSLTEMQASVLSACRSGDPDDNPFLSDRHVLVSGGTSSGKTTVTEIMAVSSALNERGSVIYVAPTRALAQARYKELIARYTSSLMFSESGSDKIILSTGEDHRDDYRFSTGRFGIGVLVYEKANLLAGLMPDMLDRTGLIVIDEAHMLMDLDRGPRLEMFLLKVIDRRLLQERNPTSTIALRVAVISTEPINVVARNTHPLIKLLTVTKSITGAEKLPIQIEATERPGVVEHKLVLPPVIRSNKFDIIDIETYGRSDPRLLTTARLRAIEQEIWDKSRERGNRDLSPAGYADLIFALIQNRLQPTAQPAVSGRRVLVFMTAIGMIENFANRLKNAAATAKEPIREIDEQLEIALAEVEDDDERRELRAWAERGIFVHYSALPREMRDAVISRWAVPLGIDSPSEVLLATETLSYGLNLGVDDVVMCSLQAPQAQRGGTSEVKQTAYTSTEFWNMTGRAGRLGLNDTATIFVVPTTGERPGDVISRYYGEKAVLVSQLFTAADDLLARDDGERLNPLMVLSHPFAHAMLDLLRYRGRARGAADEFVSVDDLMELLNRTLFFRQSFDEAPRKRVRYALQSLLDACATIVDQDSATAASATTMRLVERRLDSSRNVQLYRITERGSDVLDTGTQLPTLVPMFCLADSLENAWQTVVNNSSEMPASLALLAVVGQNEVNAHVIRRLPEHRLERSSEEARERNHAGLMALLQEQLAHEEGVEGVADGAALASAMSDALFKFLEGEGLSSSQQELRRDEVLRLFLMMLRWIDGQSGQSLRQPVTVAFIGEKSRFRPNIPAFCERASWKLDLLARVLRPRLEPVLSDLVARVRLGCRAEAISLLETRCPGLGRSAANKMLADGCTPDRLLRSSAACAAPDLDVDHLRRSLGRDAAEQFTALAEDLCGRLDADDWRANIQRKVLRFAEEGFFADIEKQRGRSAGSAFPEAARNLFDGGEYLGDLDADNAEIILWNDDAGLREVFLVCDTAKEAAFELIERSQEHGTCRERAISRVLTIGLTQDWSACCGATEVSFAEALAAESSSENLIIAVSPWLPEGGHGAGIEDELRLRKERGQSTVFVTAPGFWTMLLLLVRGFGGPDELISPFLVGGSVNTVSVRDFHKRLTTGDYAESRHLPAAIRRALAKFRETGRSAHLRVAN